MYTISLFGFAYQVEREPQGTQRQALSSQRILLKLRENPCLPVYQAGGMSGRFVTFEVKK